MACKQRVAAAFGDDGEDIIDAFLGGPNVLDAKANEISAIAGVSPTEGALQLAYLQRAEAGEKGGAVRARRHLLLTKACLAQAAHA